MSKKEKNYDLKPEFLYRVKVERSPMYANYEKFWSLERYDEEASKLCGELTYRSTRYHGLAFTNWGLRRAIKKAMKKMRTSYSPNYIYL